MRGIFIMEEYDASSMSMENHAYEDEPSSPCTVTREYTRLEETPVANVNSIQPRELFRELSESHPDAHVYEDIASALTDEVLRLPSTVPREMPREDEDDNYEGEVNDREDIFSISKNVPCSRANGNLPGSVESLNSFHRNLTLPLRKSRPNEKTVTSSACVISREKTKVRSVQEGPPEGRDNFEVECVPNSGRHSRRRRKKDCKHCKNKINSNHVEDVKRHEDVIDGCANRLHEDLNPGVITKDNERPNIEPIFSLPNGRLPSFVTSRHVKTDPKTSTVFSISNNVNNANSMAFKQLNYDKNDIEARLTRYEVDDKIAVKGKKNRGGMKINSIYSQEHWSAKDTPIFLTESKEQEQSPFQRAYSLPARTHTPSSQNRVNLRRSVRGEPPPHPARLRKHRHGWTLHFARPLNGTGCTRSIVVLLLVILILLGVGGVALYIVFEPDKLQIIQQYLKSSGQNVSASESSSETTMMMMMDVVVDISNDSTSEPTTMRTTSFIPEYTVTSLPETTVSPEPEVDANRTEITLDLNATRYCDDCVVGEVCVALVDEEVPTCRTGPDPHDPTGCAGLCLINKQKCHRLDVDAFRCAVVEHYCLDDEWTCSNTLCIPLVKRCDGHMNCYDRSDEYNCVCDLQTHFQCGDETSCLPLERRCDGKIDCWDASDEMNCTLACPLDSEFTCSNGQCILKARFCDGLPDCADGSDEPHGCQGRCNKHEFSCRNGRCITKQMKCNGIDDCGDGTDEQHCRERFT
ncbi:uncharacterized protein LOC107270833 isoform X2 [Cephus cinctus]|uniref:Uncharacterized protein LOC107270833 isoform X2 n=1 Tax=Cephus cinctus TaxID=211228 RepID=A0AAJ7FPB4_CEPCN|nr:uncharacterized protein LOC107270833 isoform X2 [Cephus cinctus]